MSIYDNVKFFAKREGISVAKLKRNSNLSNGTISKWQKSQPRILAIRKVAALLDVSIDDLLKKKL
ncbi:helix-turn-helix domain-containing protein [Lactiplantibacillus plantarum]|uniref:helix-turn-helix domain-containing protein n=1 Tax=Lactiplantibacillus plantarum TaxID=1590 RepID=UPI0021A2CE09|nr:helix-turn-helix transcriptional regulator [Lactiplantibacillus plantarum]MCT3232993.1 XRE family transcriptional regulator [Lactiplantibacillus plantarum]MCT3551226.1 XRE family transcriptional regulator [Lactiplantibacillus plantarum]